MASGVPASDNTGRVPRRGASMASQRSACGPRRSLRPLIGVDARELKPVTARVNKKKGHSPRLYYAPRGVNIAPWGLPSCGDGARYHPDLAHHRRRIALARVRVQPTAAPAEHAVLLLPVAGRVVRGGADDT